MKFIMTRHCAGFRSCKARARTARGHERAAIGKRARLVRTDSAWWPLWAQGDGRECANSCGQADDGGGRMYWPTMPHSANPAPWVNIIPAPAKARVRLRRASGAVPMSRPSIPAVQALPSPATASSATASARPGLAAKAAIGAKDSNAAGTIMRRCARDGSSRAAMTSAATVPSGIPISRKPTARAGWPMWAA